MNQKSVINSKLLFLMTPSKNKQAISNENQPVWLILSSIYRAGQSKLPTRLKNI